MGAIGPVFQTSGLADNLGIAANVQAFVTGLNTESQVIPATSSLSDDALANACKAVMRSGSKSFFAASRVLPTRVRADATALYAFCRVADDAIDNATSAEQRSEALAQLHLRLNAIYSEQPLPYAEDILLAPIVKQHHIPQAILAALLEGFAWDARGRRYQTLDELHDYAARVAGTVGVMMAMIMGCKTEAALERACELGAAMQLTNIARDIGEDARAQRVYLPLDWFAAESIDVANWLEHPLLSPAIQRMTERLLTEADRLYIQAKLGIAALPVDCRAAILSAARVYAEIGSLVRQNNCDSVSQRAVVPFSRKLSLMAHSKWALLPLPWRTEELWHSDHTPACLPAVHFLVQSALDELQMPAAQNPAEDLAHLDEGFPVPTGQTFYNQTVWVIDLCERLAQRNRLARSTI